MKRITIVRIIGMLCICLAIACAIFGVLGSVGAMELGAPIGRCVIQAIVFGVLTWAFGKFGTALVLI